MPNPLVLSVSNGQLPAGFCPNSYQDILNQFSSLQSVTFPDTFAGVVASDTKPGDTDRVWLQLVGGKPVRLYSFFGTWLSRHPLVPGFTMIWMSALPDFTTFDGGDANVITADSTGPMWEEATELRAKIPIGVGTLPSTTVLNQGDTGGEEKHSLAANEMPPHTHFEFNADNIATGGGSDNALSTTNYPAYKASNGHDNPDYTIRGNSTKSSIGLSSVAGGDQTVTPAVVVAHNTLPPYVAVYFLRRTARIFYSVP